MSNELEGANASAPIVLPRILDLKEAAPLHTLVVEKIGKPMSIDASSVDHLGGLCLQVLLSAKQTWDASEVAFEITDSSESFVAALKQFGANELISSVQ